MQEKINSRGEDGSAQRERKLQETASLLEIAVCHGSTGFAFVDRNYRFLRINDQLARMNGLTAEQHLGLSVRDVAGREQWRVRERMLKRVFDGEPSVAVMLSGPMPHKPGIRRFLASYYPVWVEGAIAGAAVFYDDISDKAERHAALDISELRKHAILNTSLDSIVTMDHAGRIIEFNPAAERTFGYTRSEAVGNLVGDLIVPPHLRERHFKGLARYLETGDGPVIGRRVELTAMRKDGTMFPVELAVTVIQIEDRPFFTAYLRDISDRVESAQSLARRERQLQAIFESTLDAILIADDQMRCVDANPAASALFGLSRDQLIGCLVTDFVAPKHRDAAHSLWQSFQGEGRGFGEIALVMANGVERILEYSSTREFLPGLHLCILRDITDRKRAEREIRAAHESSLAMSVRQRAFLADVLASVTEGKLHLCDSAEELPIPLARFGEPILLDLRGGLSDLRRLVGDVARSQAYPDIRSGDLALATSEVATNAIKHGGGGIGAVYAGGGGPVQVWVADTGRGISMENLPKATLSRGYTTAGTLGHGLKIALQTIDRMWLLTGPSGTTIVLEQDHAPKPSIWE